MRVLDIGCGLHKISIPNAEVTGLDQHEYEGVDIVANAAEKLPFEDGEFDVVYARHFLEHVPKDRFFGFIDEVHRVLKRGGKFMITVPHASSCACYGHPEHVNYLTTASFKFLTTPEGKAYLKSEWNIRSIKLNYTLLDKIAFLNRLVNPLVNLHHGIYEKFFWGILPVDEIQVELVK